MKRVIERIQPAEPLIPARLRVAAYARISCAKDAMLHSLAAQVDFYRKTIHERPDYLFAGVYADEALTGTKDRRPEFQRLLADCRAGKIDRVLTKSISRFARNTVDLLKTVRELRQLGVDVHFEEQNIHSMSGDGELMLAILASYAQAESLSASENQKWRVQKNFREGKPVGPSLMYGYDCQGGQFEVIPEEAETIRMIYQDYLSGMGKNAIMRKLIRLGTPTKRGGKWTETCVTGILRNEKLVGDLLLQKTWVTDHLTKRKRKNHGEVPQYYVRNSHPAIVCPAEWDAVQAEMARRKKLGRPYTCDSAFSTRIVCGDCGGFYGPKVWNSNRPNRKEIWQCNEKYKRRGIPGNGCRTPHVMRADLKSRFLAAFNELTGDREELLDNCRLACETLYDCAELDREIDALGREQEAVAEHARRVIRAGAHTETEEDDQSGDLLRRYDEITQRLTVLEAERCRRAEKERVVRQFIRDIEERPLAIDTFDEQLWLAVVDRVMVNRDGGMLFLFRDGSAVEADGEATRQKHTI